MYNQSQNVVILAFFYMPEPEVRYGQFQILTIFGQPGSDMQKSAKITTFKDQLFILGSDYTQIFEIWRFIIIPMH